LTPLGECGGAAFLETLSADEGAFLVEVIVNGAVDCGEFLQTSHPPETEHRPLSSSKWLVGILGSVVFPTTNDTALMIAGSLHRRTV